MAFWLNTFLIIASLFYLISWFWLLKIAFKESVFWGLIVLLLPGGNLLFAILDWREAKTAYTVNFISALSLIMIGALSYEDELSRFNWDQSKSWIQSKISGSDAQQKAADPGIVEMITDQSAKDTRKDDSIQAISTAPDSIKPAPDSIKPAPDSIKPAPDSIKPAPDSIKPAPDSIKPAPGTPNQATQAEISATPQSEISHSTPDKELPVFVTTIGLTPADDPYLNLRKLSPQSLINHLEDMRYKRLVACMKSGVARKGSLVKVSDEMIVLQLRTASGSFEAFVKIKDIAGILLPQPGESLNNMNCQGL